MKKFTTYIMGNITVIESDVPGMVEIAIGSKENARLVTREDFNELCDLRYAIKFAPAPKPVLDIHEALADIKETAEAITERNNKELEKLKGEL